MASTYSPILGIELIGTGDQNNTWGTTTNTNFRDILEQAIAGTVTVDVSAGNVTLTDNNGSADQARACILRITGTPGVARNIIAPAKSKTYVVANGSNSSITVKTSTSTGVTLLSGEIFLMFYDTTLADFKYVGKAASSTNVANTLVLRDSGGSFGANIVAANMFNGALTGNVTGDLNGNLTATAPTANTATAGTNTTQIATTAFVKTAIDNKNLGTMSTQNANAVAITGGTIGGVTISGITALTVPDGGTGSTSLTANSVVLGNGTSALNGNMVAPSTSGNVLTSNGTTWTSAAPTIRAYGGFSAITRADQTGLAYTQNNGAGVAGTILTVTLGAGHGYTAGQYVYLVVTTGTMVTNLYQIQSVTTTTIVLTGSTSLLTSGTCTSQRCSIVGTPYNISTVVWVSAGRYVVNFTNPLSSTTYVATGSAGTQNGGTYSAGDNAAIVFGRTGIAGLRTVNGIQVFTATATDTQFANIMVMGV